MRAPIILLLVSLAIPSVGLSADTLRGTGATFPAPLYRAWARGYAVARGITLQYQPTDSGAGMDKIVHRETDFGATDAPLGHEQLAAAGLAQFPAVVGGVVPVINISGVGPGELALNGAVLADIFLGRVRRWSDPSVAALNPGRSLPSSRITVVHRGDPSGSSRLWCDYLAKASPRWRAEVGVHLMPSWPVGESGEGNEGVASYVQRTRFTIGYVEYAYARAHHLSDVLLINASGGRQRAGAQAFLAAVEAANWQDAWQGQLPIDVAGENVWPITGASFVLIDSRAERGAAREVLQFFDWALGSGAEAARALDYAPLPEQVSSRVRAQWRTLHDVRGQALWP